MPGRLDTSGASTRAGRPEPLPRSRRLAAMLTTRTLPAVLLTILTVAACGATVGPSATPTPAPTPTAVPGNGGIGGGSGGNTGGGAVGGGGIVDPGQGINPILGQATFVGPTAGLINR